MVPVAYRLLTVFLLTSALWGAEDYFISFDFLSDDAQTAYQKLRISRAMTPRNEPNAVLVPLCRLYAPNWPRLNLTQQEALLSCLLRAQARIDGWRTAQNLHTVRDTVRWRIPPLRVTIYSQDKTVKTLYVESNLLNKDTRP